MEPLTTLLKSRVVLLNTVFHYFISGYCSLLEIHFELFFEAISALHRFLKQA